MKKKRKPVMKKLGEIETDYGGRELEISSYGRLSFAISLLRPGTRYKIFAQEIEEGVFIQVGPDGDSLDLVEIRIWDDESKKHYGEVRLALHPEQAKQIAAALMACAEEMNRLRETVPSVVG